MTIRVFIPMKIPSKTAQEKKITVRNGRPLLYTPPELVELKSKYISLLSEYAPVTPIESAVMLRTTWIYQMGDKREIGEYKTTKPDTDNMIKLFKDAMTDAGFWLDDAQVAVEMTEKRYGPYEGVYVIVEELRE